MHDHDKKRRLCNTHIFVTTAICPPLVALWKKQHNHRMQSKHCRKGMGLGSLYIRLSDCKDIHTQQMHLCTAAVAQLLS